MCNRLYLECSSHALDTLIDVYVLIECRVAFGHVVGRCQELMEYIALQGPSAVLDVDDLLLREAMDVIGTRQGMCLHVLPTLTFRD